MSYTPAGNGERSSRRSVSVLLALLAVIVAAGAFQWLKTRNAPLPSTAQLLVVNGEATVTRADAGADPPLRAGNVATLQRGDELRTTTETKARLTFSGEETTELEGEGHLAILELYQTPLSRALVVSLALHQGRSLTRIRHVLFQGSRFEIETRVATVEARGTVFRCDVLDKDHVYVAAHEGVVQVSMGAESLELQAGQELHARLGQPLAAGPLTQPLVPDAGSPSTPPTSGAPTLTDRQKTLFPPAITPTRPGDALGSYTVKQGDTLYSIARQFNLSWQALWDANKDILSSPELIRSGQELRIPTP